MILVQNLSVPLDRRPWMEAKTLTQHGYRVTVISPMGQSCDRNPHEVIDAVSIYRYKGFEASSGILTYLWEYTEAMFDNAMW